MEFSLTEEQEQIRGAAAGFLKGRFQRCAAREGSAVQPGDARTEWKAMVQQGWTGLAVPERHGGAGGGLLETCLLIEELGAHQLVTPLLSTAVCAGPAIGRFGTPEQCERWLPAIAEGQVFAYARAAAGGGWGREGSQVRSAEVEDGFVLRGTAWFVPHAAVAEEFLVVTQTGAADELTVLMVAADAEGIECSPLDVVGNEPQYRLRFADVRVPRSRVLGEPGAGTGIVEFIDDRGAAATCVEMAGGARRVLEMSVEYATIREQFGRPIGAFQAVQHLCADMAVDVLGSRLIAYEAVCALDAGSGDPLTVASAKAWVSEAYQRVCARGHQVHGAIGYTAEHDLHFYLRHAVAGSLSFGDADFHGERVSCALGL
ncbi:acyl-CoA/acyl-ACP dehydrogenase [Actinomadura graeca]|uniref:Acyl-CoA/acyl-ACP dehydrogenase n=1 Tax=Actinomadura graeca TaxID=2750812 RepID=A0ABX8QUX4_9ACTN|nr:acyl-CoA dehydrogenase family protein [Actinomadura graeca]QXJ22619.1 acyl-CoA/acyl-ACP dehydrogenase [Actinomadura graeca]